MFDNAVKICYHDDMNKVEEINMFGENLELSLDLYDDFNSELKGFLKKAFSGQGLTVCFSGSRPTALPWKYNEECELCQKFKEAMFAVIDRLYAAGFTHYITGLALGFDTIMTELLLQKRDEGKNIFIECAIPCQSQTTFWQVGEKTRHEAILKRVDKVTYTSQEYHGGVYKIRNKYMVDNANLLVAVQFTPSRGTATTIDLAKKAKLPRIIFH